MRMSNNDQPEMPRHAAGAPEGDDALSRFLNWMRATVGGAKVSVVSQSVKMAAPRSLEPADMGLPLLIITPGTRMRMTRRRTPPTVRLPVPPKFLRTHSGSNPTRTQHEDYIRRRFKL